MDMQAFAKGIPVKVLPPVVLKQAATADFRKRHPEYGTRYVEIDARIVVNFIRHKLTPYDAVMTKTRDKAVVGHKGYAMRTNMRKAILMAIARAYAHIPAIVHEARRQLEEAEKFDGRAQ